MILSGGRANQLGNALFNHAHLMAAAWGAGTRYANPHFGRYADLFPRMRNDPLCAGLPVGVPVTVARPTRRAMGGVFARWARSARRFEARGQHWPGVRVVVSGRESSLVDPGGVVRVDREPFATLLASTRVLFVVGPLFRFADHEPFDAQRERILDYFAFDPATYSVAQATVDRARRLGERVVGVHIRRGDYVGYLGGRFFYDWAVYERVMRELAETWGTRSTSFVVCGDERPPPGFATGLPWVPGPGDIAGDLATLARCDRLVGPPSTFSRWASYVGAVPLFALDDAATVPVESGFVVAER